MSAPTTSYLKKSLSPWIICFSAALFFAYELMQLHLFNAISPMLLKAFNIGTGKFGTLSSTYLLADVIFLLPAGIILDRFSLRRVILCALCLCVLGTFGFGLSQTYVQACLCHFLSGIGNAFCFLSCMLLVSQWFPKKRQALVIGLVVTIGLFGGIIAQTPFSYLAQAFTWRQALFIDGLIGILIFGIVFAFVKDAKQASTQSAAEQIPFFQGIKLSLANRQNILCGLYTGLMNLPIMIIGAVWASLFLTQVHHTSLSMASFIASMICFGTIVGSPLFGWISDTFQQRTPLMLFGAFTSLIVFSLIFLIPHPSNYQLVTLFFLLGFFSSTQVLGYPTITESNPPHLTGTAMGIAAVIIMGLPMLLQPLTGKLIELNWDGTMLNGVPHYSPMDFVAGFSIFPIGFILAFILGKVIEEPKKQTSLNAQ